MLSGDQATQMLTCARTLSPVSPPSPPHSHLTAGHQPVELRRGQLEQPGVGRALGTPGLQLVLEIKIDSI